MRYLLGYNLNSVTSVTAFLYVIMVNSQFHPASADFVRDFCTILPLPFSPGKTSAETHQARLQPLYEFKENMFH